MAIRWTQSVVEVLSPGDQQAADNAKWTQSVIEAASAALAAVNPQWTQSVVEVASAMPTAFAMWTQSIIEAAYEITIEPPNGNGNGNGGEVTVSNRWRIPRYDNDRIRALLNNSPAQGAPESYCLRPKVTSRLQGDEGEGEERWDGSQQQLWEVLFYPLPDQTYTLEYQYLARPLKLTGTAASDVKFPLGNAVHAETLLAACLAVCEELKTGQMGAQFERFKERLAASIKVDRESAKLTVRQSTWPRSGSAAAGAPGSSVMAIARDVGGYLRFGYNPDEWSREEQGIVDDVLQSGVQQFFYPPVVPSIKPMRHDWSFLRQTAALEVGTTYTTGTVTATNGSATVTLVGGTWPSWAEDADIKIANGTTYTVLSRDSDTQITLADTFDGTTGSGQTFTLTRTVYDLASDFGEVWGNFTYLDRTVGYYEINVISENRLRNMKQRNVTVTGRVIYVAFRSEPVNTSGSPQTYTWKAIVWPTPDAVYNLQYAYTIDPLALVVQSNFVEGGSAVTTTIFGNPIHREALLASCLAAAEDRHKGKRGEKWERFIEKLGTAITHDLQATRAEHLGYNADYSDGYSAYPHRGTYCQDYRNVSYDGTVYP